MTIRTFFFASILSLVSMGIFVPAAVAQPAGLASVSGEKISELESMHQQATDSLIKNDFQGAIRAYSDILLMEPDDETAYTGLGQIYMILGNFRKANDAFENALEINPNNEVALYGIQKIMDPDGTEGMTNPRQLANEEALASIPAPAPAAPRVQASKIAIAPAPAARSDKRQPPIKLKKGTPTSQPRPVAAKPRKVLSRAAMRLRPGLLNAQRVQMALKNAGYYQGPVNGLLGGTFKRSLRDYQKAFGLKQTGKVDSRTWPKLSQYLTSF